MTSTTKHPSAPDLLATVSESFVRRYRAQSQSTDWGQSLAMYGVLAAYEETDSDLLRDYLRTWLSFHHAEGVPVNYFCGSWSIGLLYPEILRHFPELQLQLKDTASRIYDFIEHTALRNGNGILLHNIDLPNIYVDTVYYAAVVLSKLGSSLARPWAEEAVRQLILHLEVLQDGDKLFFIHCQENHGGKRSEGSWARGNGWVMMTLAELLTSLPAGFPLIPKLTNLFRSLSTELAQHQTSSGLWRTILDDPTSYEEVSASAMYLFAYTRGRNAGILDAAFDPLIDRAFRGLAAQVDEEGRVLGVSEGTWPGTIEYYKSLATGEWWWGTGAFLLAMRELCQVESR
jgi:unsaturated rhamnogalacturonyl hydrolase